MERNALLLFVEVDIILTDDLLVGDRIDVKKVFANLPADEIIIDDVRDIADLDLVIKRIFREDLHDRALAAEAKGADVVDADLFRKAYFFDLLLDFLEDRLRIVG